MSNQLNPIPATRVSGNSVSWIVIFQILAVAVKCWIAVWRGRRSAAQRRVRCRAGLRPQADARGKCPNTLIRGMFWIHLRKLFTYLILKEEDTPLYLQMWFKFMRGFADPEKKHLMIFKTIELFLWMEFQPVQRPNNTWSLLFGYDRRSATNRSETVPEFALDRLWSTRNCLVSLYFVNSFIATAERINGLSIQWSSRMQERIKNFIFLNASCTSLALVLGRN